MLHLTSFKKMIDCELYEFPGSTPNLAKFGGNVEFLSQVLWHGYTLFQKYYESAPILRQTGLNYTVV